MKSLAYRFLSIAIAALLVGACFAAAQAQKPKASPTPAPSAQDVEPIFTRRVRLPITVVDKKGFFVSGLTKNDFQILEDKIPQQID